MAIETRRPAYSPHGSGRPAWTREPQSDRQRAFMTSVVTECRAMVDTLAGLQTDAVMMIATAAHGDALESCTVAITTVQMESHASLTTWGSVNRGDFSDAIDSAKEMRTQLDNAVRRARVNLSAILSAKFGAVAAPTADSAEVPQGYYAVDYLDVLRFYAVRQGKGQWSGRTFFNRFRSDQEDRVSAKERATVAPLMLADLDAARARFAQELGRCCACGRTLTDATSRELGIGPDCRSK